MVRSQGTYHAGGTGFWTSGFVVLVVVRARDCTYCVNPLGLPFFLLEVIHLVARM